MDTKPDPVRPSAEEQNQASSGTAHLVRPGEKLLITITMPEDQDESEACHPQIVLGDFLASPLSPGWLPEVVAPSGEETFPGADLLAAWSAYSGLPPEKRTLCKSFEAGWNAAVKQAAERVVPSGDRQAIEALGSDKFERIRRKAQETFGSAGGGEAAAGKPPVPCLALSEGDVIQSGDLFLNMEGVYQPMDEMGRIAGIRCVGCTIRNAGAWFRPLAKDDATKEEPAP